MKKVLFFIILIAAAAAAYWYRVPLYQNIHEFIDYSACDQPITYKIGNVDQRFGLSSDAFAADITQATQIWDTVEGKTLFVQSDKGKLTINLVYDKRQLLNSQISNLENQIQSADQTIKPQIEAYKNEVADFKQKTAQLNQEIDYWNNKGGAPEDIYNKLTQEQNDLKQEAAKLNVEADQLNQSTDSYNNEVGQLNKSIDNFQTALAQKPEEGVYVPANDSITIYFNNGHAELVHTLAHELGHSLGLGHNSNPESIMYPQTTTTLVPTANDTSSLSYICRRQSLLARAQAVYKQIFSTIFP